MSLTDKNPSRNYMSCVVVSFLMSFEIVDVWMSAANQEGLTIQRRKE